MVLDVCETDALISARGTGTTMTPSPYGTIHPPVRRASQILGRVPLPLPPAKSRLPAFIGSPGGRFAFQYAFTCIFALFMALGFRGIFVAKASSVFITSIITCEPSSGGAFFKAIQNSIASIVAGAFCFPLLVILVHREAIVYWEPLILVVLFVLVYALAAVRFNYPWLMSGCLMFAVTIGVVVFGFGIDLPPTSSLSLIFYTAASRVFDVLLSLFVVTVCTIAVTPNPARGRIPLTIAHISETLANNLELTQPAISQLRTADSDMERRFLLDRGQEMQTELIKIFNRLPMDLSDASKELSMRSIVRFPVAQYTALFRCLQKVDISVMQLMFQYGTLQFARVKPPPEATEAIITVNATVTMTLRSAAVFLRSFRKDPGLYGQAELVELREDVNNAFQKLDAVWHAVTGSDSPGSKSSSTLEPLSDAVAVSLAFNIPPFRVLRAHTLDLLALLENVRVAYNPA